MLHPIRLSDFRERHTAQGDAPCISTVLCRKDTRDRTLSAAGFARASDTKLPAGSVRSMPFKVSRSSSYRENAHASNTTSGGPSGSVRFSRLRLRADRGVLKILSLAAMPFIAMWKNDTEQTKRQEKLARQQHNAGSVPDTAVRRFPFQKFRYRHRHANRRAAQPPRRRMLRCPSRSLS